MAGTNGPEHDFPEFNSTETKNYLVCSSPRTGSTYLCRLLQQTGKMGFPSEYFNQGVHVQEWFQRFSINSVRELVPILKRFRTSPNGVFGFKAHMDQFQFLRQQVLVQEAFPELKFILIQRRDLLQQAISLSKAQQTNAWSSLRTPDKQAAFDIKHIESCMDNIQSQVSGWKKLFAFFDVDYIDVWYEDLCEKPQKTITQCLEFLGEDEVEIDPGKVDVSVQRDSETQAWIDAIHKQLKY